MEFLLVVFEESRDVQVGNKSRGPANSVIELEAGEHTVTLAPPFDFSPVEQKVRLRNTAALDPCRIVFQRLPPTAIPHSPGSDPT
jgi:hypothetical protein